MTSQVWKNLQVALEQLQPHIEQLPPDEDDEEQEDDDDEEHARRPSKRTKTESKPTNKMKKKKKNKRKVKITIVDPYNIYLHSLRKRATNGEDGEEQEDDDDDQADELKTSLGGKLSQLTLSGILNGMAGVLGGLVHNRICDIREDLKAMNDAIPTARNQSLMQVKSLATILYKAVQTRIQADVLVTTPIRIQQMLAPEIQPHEFKAIRRRIYDTVILGKGVGQPPVEGSEIPTAASTGVHDLEKFKKCKTCGNNDQSLFVLDRKNGDVICSSCGTVVSESLMHEGSQYRKFEGEVDRNHHGDPVNPLMSNAHNMSTTLGGIQVTTGAGIGGYGSQKRGLENVLRNAHAYTEMNISQFGKGDRRTRTGYKDKQKRDAFSQMVHCGDALNLHEAVVQRAKELFSGFRDDRELVQQFKGVIAACLCEAFDQLSSDGKHILKQKEQDDPEQFHNPRANRRNELHHANLAGKGGLLLDFSAIKHQQQQNAKEDASSVDHKVIAAWDLDDCRSWLLEASRSIAQQWMEDRKNGVKNIPSGSQEELEGKIVEHAITLCDHLEAELKAKGDLKGKRVVTPRVTDMSKLGIKWQHSHERGSGGKGGVGNNAQVSASLQQQQQQQQQQAGRTAGQILILKTAKKLGSILNDPQAGEAIHKELLALKGRQDAFRRKGQLEEATRQRFLQMKRKPWLQARAEIES